MEMLVAMSLPGLVLALTVLGVLELSRSKHRGRGGTAMSAGGFDIIGEALHPTKHHQTEQREAEALMQEDDPDAAPPRIRLDIDKRTAHIVLPR